MPFEVHKYRVKPFETYKFNTIYSPAVGKLVNISKNNIPSRFTKP